MSRLLTGKDHFLTNASPQIAELWRVVRQQRVIWS